jgi:hypothetical protein
MHWSRSCMPCMPIKTAAKRGFYHPSFSKHNYISQRELVPWKLSIISWNHHFQWFKSPFLVVKIPKSSNEGGPIKVHGLQIGPCSTCGHTIWVQPGRLWLGIGHKPWKIPSGKPWKTITMKSDEISIWCFFFLKSGVRLKHRFEIWFYPKKDLRRTSLAAQQMNSNKLMIECSSRNVYIHIYIYHLYYIYICIIWMVKHG